MVPVIFYTFIAGLGVAVAWEDHFERGGSWEWPSFSYVCGFVKNLPNGKVFIEAQGTEIQLEELIKWCKQGPERARVDEISTAEIPLSKESEFQISR